MQETKARRNLNVWISSSGQFQEALKIARASFVDEIAQVATLPVVELSRKQYDSGNWTIPRAYGEIVRKVSVQVHTVMAKRHGIRRYSLTRGQRQLAFLEALQQCEKLEVAGLLLPQPVQE